MVEIFWWYSFSLFTAIVDIYKKLFLWVAMGCTKLLSHESKLPHLWHVDTVIHTPWLYMSRNTELHTQVVFASNVAQNL